MRAPERRRSPGRNSGRRRGRPGVPVVIAVVFASITFAVAGCRSPAAPTPSPSGISATPRPFTVMSTDKIRVTDPAAMTDAASASFAVNAFQRLMTSVPGGDVLKPDAARDCLFTTATTYTCTLLEGLTFANGDPLTSSDVKFSVERALRLNVPGSSAFQLSSLRRVETPDDLTVRFLLSRPDTQFGWALASPAASLVDEQVYDADKVHDTDEPAVGSGPFTVSDFDADRVVFTKFEDYKGFDPAGMDTVVYRSVPDSGSVEDAMNTGSVDVVWRGLDEAALTRLGQQVQQSPEQRTQAGFGPKVLVGKRVLQLAWTPSSPQRSNKALRQAIALALQGDRTLDSVVPGGVPGHVPAFPLGGTATPKVTWKTRINLTLGYDPTAPNGKDLATRIRTRLEDTGGLSVRLRPKATDADLVLLDRKAWTPTALAWLQPYLYRPLPGSKRTVNTTVNAFRAIFVRSTTDEAAAQRLLTNLQRQTAADDTVLPISQSDEIMWARRGVQVADGSFGPGWQLGLFGITVD